MKNIYFFIHYFKKKILNLYYFSLKERDAIMNEFRSGNSRVLIATDIWGRGNKFF